MSSLVLLFYLLSFEPLSNEGLKYSSFIENIFLGDFKAAFTIESFHGAFVILFPFWLIDNENGIWYAVFLGTIFLPFFTKWSFNGILQKKHVDILILLLLSPYLLHQQAFNGNTFIWQMYIILFAVRSAYLGKNLIASIFISWATIIKPSSIVLLPLILGKTNKIKANFLYILIPVLTMLAYIGIQYSAAGIFPHSAGSSLEIHSLESYARKFIIGIYYIFSAPNLSTQVGEVNAFIYPNIITFAAVFSFLYMKIQKLKIQFALVAIFGFMFGILIPSFVDHFYMMFFSFACLFLALPFFEKYPAFLLINWFASIFGLAHLLIVFPNYHISTTVNTLPLVIHSALYFSLVLIWVYTHSKPLSLNPRTNNRSHS